MHPAARSLCDSWASCVCCYKMSSEESQFWCKAWHDFCSVETTEANILPVSVQQQCPPANRSTWWFGMSLVFFNLSAFVCAAQSSPLLSRTVQLHICGEHAVLMSVSISHFLHPQIPNVNFASPDSCPWDILPHGNPQKISPDIPSHSQHLPSQTPLSQTVPPSQSQLLIFNSVHFWLGNLCLGIASVA